MFHIVSTGTSQLSLITVSPPTGSVYAYGKGKKKEAGFYLSVFPDFSLIAERLFLSRPLKRGAALFNSYSADEELLMLLDPLTELAETADLGSPHTHTHVFFCLSAGERT